MENKYRVLLVEDNEQTSRSMKTFIDGYADLQIHWIARDSLQAIAIMKDNAPDLILLDLVMPKSNGFVLLEYIHHNVDVKPPVIVISSLTHSNVIQKACRYGAAFYMAKPFRLSDMYNRIRDVLSLEPKPPALPIREARSVSDSPFENLESFLISIGIFPHMRGFLFLRSTITIIKENPSYVYNLTRQLYPAVANACETTATNVEHAIRYSIETAWNCGKLKTIQSFSQKRRPTNGEFISTVAKKFLSHAHDSI